ncbi:MAG: hypothetical protein MUF51_06170 [Vicinamibacteria bacterium]|nr:hypothetical protein [Vicinamibacteria bacterium]
MMRIASCAILLMLATSPSITHAQDSPSSDDLRARLRLVAYGRVLRVATQDQRQRKGVYAGIRDDRIILVDEGDQAIPIDDVAVVWQDTRRVREGAITGGFVYAALGITLAAALPTDTAKPAGLYVGFGALLAVPGAMHGALVGTHVSKWQEIYRAAPLGREAESIRQAPSTPARSEEEIAPFLEPSSRSTLERRFPNTWTASIGSSSIRDEPLAKHRGGLSLHSSFTHEIHPRLDLGFEIGAEESTTESGRYSFSNDAVCEGAFIRFRPIGRTWQPFLIGGVALTMNEHLRLSPSVGAGLLLFPKNYRYVFGVSGRYYANMDRRRALTLQVQLGQTF